MTANVLGANKAEVRFQLAGGAQPLILVPTLVNGRGPFQFILDTGAGTTVLSSALAQQLDIAITGAKQGHSAAGALDVQLGEVDSLAVGELVRERIDVAVLDLSHVERTIGAGIDGDLGHNFFGALRLTIDYRREFLMLEDPARVEYFGPVALTEVPTRLANLAKPLLLVDAHVNGRGPFCFAIDTGTSTTALDDELANELQLRTTEAGPVTTGSTPISMRAARVQSLRIGACQQTDFGVVVGGFLPMLSSVVGVKLDGVVGYNFLRNYKVVIDYRNSTFSLFGA